MSGSSPQSLDVDPLGVGTPTPTWGLGQVGAGILISFLLSNIVGAIIISIAGWTSDDLPVWGMAILQIPLWGGYVGAVIYSGRRLGNGVVDDFGVRSTVLDAPVGLVLGILTQLVVLPVVYIPILWAVGSDTDELSRPARELADRADSPVGWVLLFLIVGVGAPVVEELFYRGLFLRSLRKTGMATWACVAVSSAVFAAMHLQPLQFPGLLLFGLLAGTLVARTGRVGPAIWAHIGFNTTAVVSLYLQANASDALSILVPG